MPRRNAEIDIFLYVDTKEGDQSKCWPWIGTLGGRDDRPVFNYDGKREFAARVMYRLTKGPIPDGQVVRHTCDNNICCNPNHFELGTQSDNENDKYKRDRAGLPVGVVREIRRLLATTTLSQRDIADLVSQRTGKKVSRSAVRDIHLGARRTQGDELTQEEIMKDKMQECVAQNETALDNE